MWEGMGVFPFVVQCNHMGWWWWWWWLMHWLSNYGYELTCFFFLFFTYRFLSTSRIEREYIRKTFPFIRLHWGGKWYCTIEYSFYCYYFPVCLFVCFFYFSILFFLFISTSFILYFNFYCSLGLLPLFFHFQFFSHFILNSFFISSYLSHFIIPHHLLLLIKFT